MSAASDVTTLRQIVAQYAVDSQAKSAWSTFQPISTSSLVTANGISLSTQSIGTATLGAGGTVTVPASLCTVSSFIFITAKTIIGTQGVLSAVSGAGSFAINSSQSLDRSVVQWMIVNPA